MAKLFGKKTVASVTAELTKTVADLREVQASAEAERQAAEARVIEARDDAFHAAAEAARASRIATNIEELLGV